MTENVVDADVQYGVPPLAVHIVKSDLKDKRPREYRVSHRTIALSAANPFVQLAGIDPARKEVHIEILDNQVVLSTGIGAASDPANGPASVVSTPQSLPVPSQPPIPASTVAVQNTNLFPVQVVISAGTITNVSVNGITVGTAAGTYVVPSFGAISITYSVAPTWVWSNASAALPNIITSLANPNGRILNPLVGEYVIPGGANEIWFSAALFPARVNCTIVRDI